MEPCILQMVMILTHACMHTPSITHTDRCFHFFPKVGLKFEADHIDKWIQVVHIISYISPLVARKQVPQHLIHLLHFAAHSALRATGGRFLWLCSLWVCVYHQRFSSRMFTVSKTDLCGSLHLIGFHVQM